MKVTPEIQQKVIAKLKEGIAMCEAHFNCKFEMPAIKYNIRGTTAGKAFTRRNLVDFNPTLLMENGDKFIARTVPHELAHLVHAKMFPEDHRQEISYFARAGVRRTKRDVHGENWKMVMRVMGADPSRCHTYDTSSVKIKRGGGVVKCESCSREYALGPKRIANLVRNPSYYRCKCKGSLHVVRVAKEQFAKVAPAVVADGMTKLDRCRKVFARERDNLSRSEMILLFVAECGCTPAGASTYYSTLKNG